MTHSAGSGHVHGGRDGRMSFEQRFDELVEDVITRSEGEVLLHPTLMSRPSKELDDEARAYFREKLERL